MKKNITLLIIAFLTFSFSFGQTTLAKEDIAIIGVNTDNEDFTFLLRTDITSGTEIYFTDNEVNVAGTGLLDTNEGIVLFTAAADYSCGTVLGYIVNSAEFANFSGSFILNNGGDEVLAFQGYNSGTLEWTTFLHANVDPPINLPVGFTAADIVDGNRDNRQYIGSTTNPSWADLNLFSNYNHENNYAAVTLSTASFVCVICSSTVTWSGGVWSGTPDLTTEVIIADNYDTSVGGLETSFSACSITVNSGFRLTIGNGDYVEVENYAEVNGELYVSTEGNFIQNDDSAVFIDNSTNGVRLTKTKNMFRKFAYTYWSSPIVDETIEDVFFATPGDRRFYFDAAAFVDNLAEIANTNTFNPGQDDIDDNGDDWKYASGTMTPGVGYTTTAGFAPSYPNLQSFIFTGEFNNGIIQVPVVDNSGGAYSDWNFLGNPYPGAISIDQLFTVNAGIIDAIYLWDQFTPEDANASGSQGNNFSDDDYALVNGTMETAGASGNIPNRFIASGQGFFVEALAAGNVTFNNSMRAITNDNSQFFRGSSNNDTYNKLWIGLTSDNGVSRQIGIGYVDGATTGFDGSFYDTKRNLSTGGAAIIYSIVEANDGLFAIQGKSPSDLIEDEIINLGFNTDIDVDTTYKISVDQFQGDFLSSHFIYLKDTLLDVVHNLSNSDYEFSSETGEFKERFQIAFNASALLSTDDMLLEDNSVSIIKLEDNKIQFKVSNNSTIKTISIYDMLGRQLYALEGNNNIETYTLSNLNNTVFIAKVELNNGNIITKKAFK